MTQQSVFVEASCMMSDWCVGPYNHITSVGFCLVNKIPSALLLSSCGVE